ncbi:MAG: hypothetical protein C0506_08010 [Anaerolinea sp.]|nr:hypothetical protein [Anaerolinea sp.]
MSPPERPPAALAAHLPLLEETLKRAIGGSDSPLASASRYVMGWEDEHGRAAAAGGKRIRPALCLFAAESLGGRVEDAIPGAVAVELVHNFSLVHDEIQDHDLERHSRPTTWARFGEGQAINVGDYLYTRAVRALTDGPGDVGRRMRALAILHEAIGQMIEGQWQDLEFESRDSVQPHEYLAMVARKTGALLGAPLEMGSVLAGIPPEQSAQLGEWGRAVGLAFQIQDDFLGIWGDPDETGKSNRGDIMRKKKTLPIVFGLADAGARDVISTAYARPALAPDDADRVVAALDRCGAARACAEEAHRHAANADRLLRTFELGPRQAEQFRAIASYIIDRRA